MGDGFLITCTSGSCLQDYAQRTACTHWALASILLQHLIYLSPVWDICYCDICPNKSFQSSLWLKDTGVIKIPRMKESTSYTCYWEGCTTSRAVLIMSQAARCSIAATDTQPRITQDNWLGEVWHILAVENLTYKRNDRTGRELSCFIKSNSNKENQPQISFGIN